MVEVFKTNVADSDSAAALTDQLEKVFAGHEINFDLEDCDNILRVELRSGIIDTAKLVKFLNSQGYTAEVLPDEADLLAG